ncbi:MAG: hypothetical protein K2N16_10425 [Muribaculaceae bacterium]|nr:hypothetical protein [Muribaculaceae bacterium]
MRKTTIIPALAALLASCAGAPKPDGAIDSLPPIQPDYAGVTYPPNMAPPVFMLANGATDAVATFSAGDVTATSKGSGSEMAISPADWAKVTNAGDSVTVSVMAKIDGKWMEYRPFSIYISSDSIDAYLSYRLIEPGYESWAEMGLYQRCLANYDEEEIFANSRNGYGCVNCHAYCGGDGSRALLHMRVNNAGTYVIDGDNVTKLNTKTPQTISALVYPYWHPGGRYVAFSTNDTDQKFHTSDPNRIEVMDYASDVVVLDTETNEIVTSPLLSSADAFETFPAFSPDGRTLYFCTADRMELPAAYDQLRYSICSVGFDPNTRTFGNQADTIYHAQAGEWGSASFPRVSPDGRWLMATLSGYGTFSIWHRDSDLYLIDLATKEMRPLSELNSDESESYHSWSSTGRWVAFSSRRGDGLYTRPHIAHIDADGNATKPFALPQARADHYAASMKSYNIPEFSRSPLSASPRQIEEAAKGPGIDAKFAK